MTTHQSPIMVQTQIAKKWSEYRRGVNRIVLESGLYKVNRFQRRSMLKITKALPK